MVSSVVALLVAAAAMQPADTTRSAREAYTGCLRGFVERSLNERMTAEAFQTAFPQACPQQEAAYRAAVIARENAMRATRANAAESADTEIEDARFNFRERFEMATPAATPAPAPAPAPAAPPAQPAATTTPQ